MKAKNSIGHEFFRGFGKLKILKIFDIFILTSKKILQITQLPKTHDPQISRFHMNRPISSTPVLVHSSLIIALKMHLIMR